ncbi:hypothetical protein GCM10010446_32660 [Streptomyces enissocaesilis]|uniref:Uncharacterized protein n=2 Tax=Streptomyces enissocaesilis TaxID=332589 RepID=A0ABN3XA47_9ACTN
MWWCARTDGAFGVEGMYALGLARDPGCANIARTDQHAVGLRHYATALDQQAGRVPGPLGERLHDNATRLRDLADAHDRTRTTLRDGIA